MATAELAFFFLNGEMKKTEDFGALFQESAPVVYDVIRIVRGKPLFPKEHYERLVGSLASIGRPVPITCGEFCGNVRALAEANGVENYNCRLVITGFGREKSAGFHSRDAGEPSKAGPDVCLYMIPTHYPSAEQYEKGVKVDFLRAVRKNPHSKIWNQELRDASDRMIREKGLFEAVLLNEKDQITEGSRSNVFFIRGDEAFTTPGEAVLLGVTRTKVIEACEYAGIKVNEVYTAREEIGGCEAAFLCGTSPKVLPIADFGGIVMDVKHTTLRRIMALYDSICERSLG